MIVTGAAQTPKYLYIGEDKVELRDASHVWGKGIRDTEDTLRKESGHQDARIGAIGPAGENLDPRRHVGQRLQSHRGARPGRRDGLEETQSLRRLGHQAAARARQAIA